MVSSFRRPLFGRLRGSTELITAARFRERVLTFRPKPINRLQPRFRCPTCSLLYAIDSRCRCDDDVRKAPVFRAGTKEVAAADRELMLRVGDALAVHFDAALFDEAFAFARRFHEPRLGQSFRN